jgi:hypothetical protein
MVQESWRVSPLLGEEKREKGEVNVPMPRVYFFFAGAFLTSFLTGFLATDITSGLYICQ